MIHCKVIDFTIRIFIALNFKFINENKFSFFCKIFFTRFKFFKIITFDINNNFIRIICNTFNMFCIIYYIRFKFNKFTIFSINDSICFIYSFNIINFTSNRCRSFIFINNCVNYICFSITIIIIIINTLNIICFIRINFFICIYRMECPITTMI